MLSKTAEYAIRAVLTLAGLPQGEARSAGEIAQALGVPRNYLSKTLNRLAKRGLLVSVRGPRGGFRLAQPAREISMAEVVGEFDQVGVSGQCVMGGRACDKRNPCVAHERWKVWTESLVRLLDETTVADFTGGSNGHAAGAAGSRVTR